MYAKMGDGFRFAHDSEFSFVLLAVLFFVPSMLFVSIVLNKMFTHAKLSILQIPYTSTQFGGIISMPFLCQSSQMNAHMCIQSSMNVSHVFTNTECTHTDHCFLSLQQNK